MARYQPVCKTAIVPIGCCWCCVHPGWYLPSCCLVSSAWTYTSTARKAGRNPRKSFSVWPWPWMRWARLKPVCFTRVGGALVPWTSCSWALTVFSVRPWAPLRVWGWHRHHNSSARFACVGLNKAHRVFWRIFYGIVTLLVGKCWSIGKSRDRMGYLSRCHP